MGTGIITARSRGFVALVLSFALPVAANAASIDEGARAASAAIDAIALRLHTKLVQPGKSLCWSPFSVMKLLTLAGAGAGTARGAWSKVLGVPLEEAGTHARLAALRRLITQDRDQVKLDLHMASSAWFRQGLVLDASFQQLLVDPYKVKEQTLDFRDPPAARETINRWVVETTHGKIKELLPAGHPSEDTVLVLANAIYMKASWAAAFSKGETREAPFTSEMGTRRNVPLMHASDLEVSWMKDDAVQVLDIPFEGGLFAFTVILPDDPRKLGALESRLDGARLAAWTGRLKGVSAEVWLPRFRIEWDGDLVAPLSNLGLPMSGLSGMASDAVDISLIRHKTYVDVNEAGVEAAAATAADATLGMAEDQPSIRVDHAFLFAIRHIPSGLLLFLGRET